GSAIPARGDCGEGLPMILAIANQKGGVGKTTTAINLAASLALQNRRTLLIDMDPQANSTLCFVERDGIQTSLYEALIDSQIPIRNAVIHTGTIPLSLIPSRLSLAKLESKLIGEIDGHFRLKDRIAPLTQEYPYIIIDTPPTLGLITVNALVAATHLLIPVQSSYFALEGTDDLLETFRQVKGRLNPDLKLLGLVITLHDKRTTLSQDTVDRIREDFGERVFQTIISKSVRLEESPAYRESIFTYAPKSSGAIEYEQLCKEVLSRE